MPAHQSTIEVLGRLFWHSIILQEHWGGCASTTEYYRSTGEAVLAHYNTTGALGSLCWYIEVLYEYWLGCASRVEYYMSTGETAGTEEYYRNTAWRGCSDTTEYYRTREAVLVHEYYRNTWDTLLVQWYTIRTLGRLCWYRRVL